jgi:hypothetical protein
MKLLVVTLALSCLSGCGVERAVLSLATDQLWTAEPRPKVRVAKRPRSNPTPIHDTAPELALPPWNLPVPRPSQMLQYALPPPQLFKTVSPSVYTVLEQTTALATSHDPRCAELELCDCRVPLLALYRTPLSELPPAAPTSAGTSLPNQLLHVRLRRGATASGTGGRVGPTSNDEWGPRPIGDPSPLASLLASAACGAAAVHVEASAGLRSSLWTTPNLRRAPLPSRRHRGLIDVDQSLLATSLFLMGAIPG